MRKRIKAILEKVISHEKCFLLFFMGYFAKLLQSKLVQKPYAREKNVQKKSKIVQEKASGHFNLNGNHISRTTMKLDGISYILAHER